MVVIQKEVGPVQKQRKWTQTLPCNWKKEQHHSKSYFMTSRVGVYIYIYIASDIDRYMYIHMCVILRVKFLNKHINYTFIVFFFFFSNSQMRKVKLGWLKQNHLSLTHNLLLTVIMCSCSTISYFLLCAINCRRAQRPFLYKKYWFWYRL